MENNIFIDTITANDPDGDILTFTLADSLGADNSLFSITNEGLLSFNDASDFENPADTDGNNIYQLGVQVSDGEESVAQLINVTVTNENETSINRAPVFTSDNSLSVNENLKLVTTVTAEDIDGDNLVFSLSNIIGRDNALFSITEEGELSFNNAPDFENPIDNDGNNIYQLGIQVSDGNNLAIQLTQITINDVNETSINNPPTAINLNNTITELAENIDIRNGIKVADINVNDDNFGLNLLSLIGSDENDFTLRNASELFYIGGSPNFEIKNNYSVTVVVDDTNVGETPDASIDFTLIINDVNESPSFTSGTIFNVLENNVFIDNITAIDPDGDTFNLHFS